MDQILPSEESLNASRDPDEFVRKAFYDAGRTFLFRFYVAEENDDPEQYPGIWGDFDLTGPTPLIREFSARLSGEDKDRPAVVGAKEFFDKVYLV